MHPSALRVSDWLALGGGDLTPRAPHGRKKVVVEEGTVSRLRTKREQSVWMAPAPGPGRTLTEKLRDPGIHWSVFAQLRRVVRTGARASGCTAGAGFARLRHTDPVSREGARYERADLPGRTSGIAGPTEHPGSPAHHDSAARPDSDCRARLAAALRSTGVDGAHRPVAPAGALARHPALPAGGEPAATGCPGRPGERLRALPRHGRRHRGRPAVPAAGCGTERPPEPCPEPQVDADRLRRCGWAGAPVRLRHRSPAGGRASER